MTQSLELAFAGRSNLSGSQIEELMEQTRRVYLENNSPWVIGFSGGKDSSATLQLVWNAIAALPEVQRQKPVYVLSSDTLVETPVVVDYIIQTLDKINTAAKLQNMPFEAHKVEPVVEDTFWVNLIGKGYPAPSNNFRWCTERLKIKPANAFILGTVAKYGEAIVVLGVRKAESMTRAQSMSLREIKGSILRRHTTLPGAFVYAPIEDLSTEDVWSYLLSVPCPWGNNNRDLVAMYRNAHAGECPLVVDTTTPSCGNSRFGCWVCTVVERDKTMEAMIDNGEEWLEPLLDFRDLLSSTQPPEEKAKYRSHRRTGGKISFKEDGGIIRGPYRLDFCKELLGKLLTIQKGIWEQSKDRRMELITLPELHEIRRIWRDKRQDWEDAVVTIYRAVIGDDVDWPADDTARFSQDDRAILDEICEREGIPSDLMAKMLDTERLSQGMTRRAAVLNQLQKVLNEDWRTEDEVLTEQARLRAMEEV